MNEVCGFWYNKMKRKDPDRINSGGLPLRKEGNLAVGADCQRQKVTYAGKRTCHQPVCPVSGLFQDGTAAAGAERFRSQVASL